MKLSFEVEIKRLDGVPAKIKEIERALEFVFTTYEFQVVNGNEYSTYDIVSAKAKA